ncbi:CLAVATA3/ESR (CLE)-related protein 40 [Mangifera indica]|uniref:CLAVATA3/ESR (CLE)-related protein 40 n=1 Tax=Mangifera indica TaxID=29780 RepID=UPI001CFA9247|nr:CLAVATA3/ESR (CLE)-related protein 40 [Mangifera indica]
MAFKQKVSISLLIIMVITAPFVHSSRSYGGIEPARDTSMPTKVIFVKSLGINGDNQQSARQVPTGPDPLHHNGSPARP